MGGNDRKADNEDNKRKKKKRKKTHSDSEEDDRRTKRHRTERDERDKSKKRKHHSDKEKKSKEKRKRKHKQHGDQSKLKIQELTSDDYFSKNNEFATWLKEEKDVFFSDLASDSARKFFSEFVEEWNSKKLESQYYEGIATGPRTAHKWKIRQ